MIIWKIICLILYFYSCPYIILPSQIFKHSPSRTVSSVCREYFIWTIMFQTYLPLSMTYCKRLTKSSSRCHFGTQLIYYRWNLKKIYIQTFRSGITILFSLLVNFSIQKYHASFIPTPFTNHNRWPTLIPLFSMVCRRMVYYIIMFIVFSNNILMISISSPFC